MSNTRRRTRTKRTEFENVTQGYLGAIKINRKGDEDSVPVAPGDRIFLTDEEIELTEQSHAREQDSPFREREIVHFEQATSNEIKRFRSAPLRRVVREPAREPVAA